jgi:hypothetical protein
MIVVFAGQAIQRSGAIAGEGRAMHDREQSWPQLCKLADRGRGRWPEADGIGECRANAEFPKSRSGILAFELRIALQAFRVP